MPASQPLYKTHIKKENGNGYEHPLLEPTGNTQPSR
ncbi:Uncharacterised protein [Bacillus pumilus]|nr:Uncharacterised protein [Bacillus pumilus]